MVFADKKQASHWRGAELSQFVYRVAVASRPRPRRQLAISAFNFAPAWARLFASCSVRSNGTATSKESRECEVD